ncbi:MAG: hypothetical protein AAGA67_11430, partial [Cyanobacteria bacterium P01_F01_bin.153]
MSPALAKIKNCTTTQFRPLLNMHPLISKCFIETNSSDERVKSDALVDLSFVLEMNTRGLSQEEKRDKYSHYVPADLVEIEPIEKELTEIVSFLENKLEKGEISAIEFFPLLRNTSASLALIPVINALKNPEISFDEDTLYQALASLEKLLFWTNDLSFEHIKSLVEENRLGKIIARFVFKMSPISQEKLNSLCTLLLSKLAYIDEMSDE